MPGIVDPADGLRKRKRGAEDLKRTKTSRSKPRAITNRSEGAADLDLQPRILLLETEILESRKHYNNIVKLLQIFSKGQTEEGGDTAAAISLCRVFSRLMAAGSMTKTKDTPHNEQVIVQWLKERYIEYTDALQVVLRSGEPHNQSTALTLLMRVMKDDAAHLTTGEDYGLPLRTFKGAIWSLVEADDGQEIRDKFIASYVEEYDDIRFYTFQSLAEILSDSEIGASPARIQNALSILAAIETAPSAQDEIETFYIGAPKRKKHPLHSLSAHRRQAQGAWLALLRTGLNKAQRKTVLGLMSHRIAPWFVKVELLMDFLTDSYNVGGSTSLLALSGLFYLIQEKNLDYPLFYQKLYSLLDASTLHSRHRSRFFRLMDTFLSSTHLPAAMVASFIKRLSRLTLHAPPAGIVTVIPWVYNLLKKHPTCTFMIHRDIESEEQLEKLDEEGMHDPFDVAEMDPMRTNAIDSSLWELVMLQSHFHPNVATLAKIISEQFTKQAYNLEDFLDHSYASMLDVELSKEIRKPPVVEYEIPKRIFTKADSDMISSTSGGAMQPAEAQNILAKLWDLQ
ncbi:MAG: hypothetical protein M4579_003983 [Chaenotheca gracillima]|nr:MAG: hypothetical protein M4579_003983 [Chaenotheca gracillima]